MTWSLFSFLARALRVPVVLVLAAAFVWFMVVGASAAATQATYAIIGFLDIVVVPLAAKYLSMKGGKVAYIVYAGSLAIGLGVGFATGDLSIAQLQGGSVAQLLAFTTAAFGLQQLAFQGIKDDPVLGKYAA